MRLFVLFCIILSSCGYRIKDEGNMQAVYDAVPEISITNLEFYDISKNVIKNRAAAEKAELFDNSRKSEIVMHNFTFEQYGQKNEKSAVGSGDKATRFNNNKNIEIAGNINIKSFKEKVEISTDYLLWQENKNILTGKSDVPVSIIKDDGTNITGYGFSVEAKKNIATFDKGVTGVFISKKNQGQNP